MTKPLWITILFLCLFLVLFSFNTINLPTADIGRHIVNGKILLHSSEYGVSKSSILYTNFFSYTNTDFPFINHHWLSGILVYLVFQISGFSGLSIIYFLLILFALVFSILTVREQVKWNDILLVGLFLLPLIAGRVEVRPEGLSYFFLSLFLYILFKYSKDELSPKFLWLLPSLELFWVNTHIYFIFGPFLIGMFLLQSIIFREKEKIKKLAIILATSSLVLLINPYGFSGAVYPFTIFQNYGYRIVENQSINFLEKLSFANPDFLWYKIALFFVITSSIFVFIKKRKDFPLALFGISMTFAVLAYLGIRHIPAFALLSLPLMAYNLNFTRNYFDLKIKDQGKITLYCLALVLVLGASLFHFSNRLSWNRNFSLGVDQIDFGPIAFIQKTGIHGPFFNNYDIGGFMIFYLFPKEKVFVDNRPEAYPKEFFDSVYIPMQENDIVWQKELIKENFNAIFFYRLDYTPWGQKFLVTRITDPAWAPVFVDDKTIIFLRRNTENKNVIEKFELPKEIFRVQ